MTAFRYELEKHLANPACRPPVLSDPYANLTLRILAEFADHHTGTNAHPAQESIAERGGMGRSTVHDRLPKLEAAAVIEQTGRKTYPNGKHVKVFRLLPWWDSGCVCERHPESEGVPASTAGCLPQGAQGVPGSDTTNPLTSPMTSPPAHNAVTEPEGTDPSTAGRVDQGQVTTAVQAIQQRSTEPIRHPNLPGLVRPWLNHGWTPDELAKWVTRDGAGGGLIVTWLKAGPDDLPRRQTYGTPSESPEGLDCTEKNCNAAGTDTIDPDGNGWCQDHKPRQEATP